MHELEYASPYGTVKLSAEDGKLCQVILVRSRAASARRRGRRRGGPLMRFAKMLDRYFEGQNVKCEPAMLCLEGLSSFQRLVYDKLMTIGFGGLLSYGELARLCGRPGAARAVGRAVGANPVPIFVPCHRVVAAELGLGGFGAGLAWKRRLLRHEGWLVRQGRLVPDQNTTPNGLCGG